MTSLHSLNRQFLLFIVLLSTVAGLSAEQAGESPVKIFILAGQSNMLGHGEISPVQTEGTLEYVVANDPEGNYQFLVDGLGDWVVRDDVWIRDQGPMEGGLTVGYGARNDLIGPELGFGHYIGDLNEEQVLIVKAAWGGKSLAVDFRPPSSGSYADPATPYATPTAPGDDGFYYSEILRLVDEAINNLGTYFPDYDEGGYEIAGFGWHQGWNDRDDPSEYETNMANFIRDIRSAENGIGVPDLPFVIATTGMDGKETYTELEEAQLAMADATAYPEFDGNVFVIDTWATYEGLEFWQPVELSPRNQGYHWNRNAKTYTNLGLAMGDAMSLLVPGRCPFRPRVVGEASGVSLSWQNGTELPTSVRILRNGAIIAAAAPVDPPVFLDTTAEPGVLKYELQFNMPGDPCEPLTVTLNGGITGFDARPVSGGIELSWTNNMAYDGIEVRRNDVVLEAALSGSASSYIDSSAPGSGMVTYSVVPTNGNSAPASEQLNFNLVGELGVLDPLLANNGINPATGLAWAAGDTYRFISVTTTTSGAPDGTDSDIGTYNTWINTNAAANGHGAVNWNALASTSAVDARDNTGTNPTMETGAPILLFDGLTLIADDNEDLWDAIIASPVNVDFSGNVLSGKDTNTGTAPDGTGPSSGVLGGPYADRNGTEIFAIGSTGQTNNKWVDGFARAPNPRLYFAISDLLTIHDISAVSGYYDWASGAWEGDLTDSDPDLDLDGGGLKTGVEWVVGGDPTSASDDVLVAPSSDNSDATFFTFTYRIRDAASADENTTVTVEYGSDLSLDWTDAVDNDDTIEISSADGTGDDEGFDIVTVQIARSLAVGEKLFARLNVSVAAP
ncbi:hypothetical protein DDZ13_03730 [Coraliomargarita sinensis]|uniref:Sialate O-acetylesterase domain-containing protein n=1 Tax=Coraliomargarita sinensis TaxID=2174842 RepID=A0A317ZHN6_9BACT|nr:sialate O-acetylesterase [Coraliomargarita sinensis]PXA05085.1 hypothetical protein DDZ13_03730 [Coraliomargarita sinensis]